MASWFKLKTFKPLVAFLEAILHNLDSVLWKKTQAF